MNPIASSIAPTRNIVRKPISSDRKPPKAGPIIQPRDIVLLSLLRACGLLELVFLRDERKLASRKINQLFYNQALTDPVLQTIQEIESAIVELVEDD